MAEWWKVKGNHWDCRVLVFKMQNYLCCILDTCWPPGSTLICTSHTCSGLAVHFEWVINTVSLCQPHHLFDKYVPFIKQICRSDWINTSITYGQKYSYIGNFGLGLYSTWEYSKTKLALNYQYLDFSEWMEFFPKFLEHYMNGSETFP